MDCIPNTEQRILSICSGSLGIERGIKRAGTPLRTVAYVEIEAFINQNLIAGMEGGMVDQAPIWTDCKTFDGSPFYNKIHGITAGYPCQPFSNAGHKKGLDDPRHLYPHIERIIESANPIWCFFENVAEHLNEGFDTVYESLKHLGYSVEAGLYTAYEAGAPQERKRIFILAFKLEYLGFGRFLRRDQQKRELTQRCDQLADSIGIRRHQKRGAKTTFQSQNVDYRSIEEWPMPIGPDQYKWEARRTIPKRIRRKSGTKSGMGRAAHGYDFRKDLLRMFGNAVVEQTSAIAWVDLWQKQFNNYQRNKILK